MKKITGILLVILIMGACGPYQKALKDKEIKPKYDLAIKYYEEGVEKNRKAPLRKSIRLLEQILPQYQGKPQGERLAYMYADGYYRLKDYFDAGYQFERFLKTYPQSDKAEEVAFKGAKSYYNVSPRYTLDQTETDKALVKLQEYIAKYPGGEHISEANQLVHDLRDKLEKKEFKVAELYYHQDDYKSAIASMDNFINENPGSPYREKAYYYRMDAQYVLAVKSVREVMKGRLEKTQKFSEDYIKYFPEGEYVKKAKDINEDSQKRLEDF